VGGLTFQATTSDNGSDQFPANDQETHTEPASGAETTQDSGGDSAFGGDTYFLTASGTNDTTGSVCSALLERVRQMPE